MKRKIEPELMVDFNQVRAFQQSNKNYYLPILLDLYQKFGGISQGRVVDLGCGTGDFDILLSEQFSELTITGYDGSDASGTSQKIWRAVTPEDIGKIARIVSWSLDPNRDTKFDAAIIDTITNFKQSRGIASAKDALREVLKTLDVFRCTEDGRLKIQPDEYLEQLQARNSISRVGGMQAPVSSLSDDELEALKNGNADAWNAAKQEVSVAGKKYKSTTKQGNKPVATKSSRTKLLEHARKVITTIIENTDIIVYGTNSTQLNEALEKLKHDTQARQSVESVFNIPFELIKDLFDRNIIKQDYVELLVDQ